jgi:hypothetical protein
MCRERMAHRVAGGSLGNPRLADSLLHLALHGSLVEVVAGYRTARGCGQRVEERKTYCQHHSPQALGHFFQENCNTPCAKNAFIE